MRRSTAPARWRRLRGALLAAVAALAVPVGACSEDDEGRVADPSGEAPAGLGPAEVEGLAGLRLTIYGDSWSIPGPWHSPGRHWSDLLAPSLAGVDRRGVGNTTMEDAVLRAGGAGPAGWTAPATPTCVLVMSMYNTARYPNDVAAQRPASLASMRAAASSIAAIVLSDLYGEERTDLTTFAGPWASVPNPNAAGGRIHAAAAGSVTFVVPDGYEDRQLWMATITGRTPARFRITREGADPATAVTPVSDPTSVGYTKHLLPVGRVSSGDTVTVESVSGGFWFDGMHLDSGAGHVVLVTEPSDMHAPSYPVFDNEEQLDAHNDVVREVVDEVDELVPGGASLVDLDAADGWDQPAMIAADQIHPNDLGQRWIASVMAEELVRGLAETDRLR